jgi:8-oxo-dGTP pyrophosphatase MutT (NUDIX family)
MSKTRTVPQSAAVAIYKGRVCLITTSSGKRWIVPKGHRELGHSARKTAKLEAWEEAGIAGEVYRKPLGDFVYEKDGTKRKVTVFAMEVKKVADRWPERKKRKRRWLSNRKAKRRIEYPGLRRLIAAATSRRAS